MLARAPQYGYGHFRYAEYLYKRALAQPSLMKRFTNQVCQNYGLALSYLASTHLLRMRHEKQATSAPTWPAASPKSCSSTPPLRGSGYNMGQGIGRKGDAFWAANQVEVLAYLRESGAPFDYYLGLSRGLAEMLMVKASGEILTIYSSYYPQDARGWEALLRHLDKFLAVYGQEQMEATLTEAVRHSTPQLPYSLYTFWKKPAASTGGI